MIASDMERTTPGPDSSNGMTDARPRLELLDVSKSFGPVRALQDVTFDVMAGEIHGLVGENGAGKSTLMAVAAGALRPDAGTVTIDGTAVNADPSLSRSLGLAMVRQHPALFPELTVADNLMFGVTAKVRSEISNPVRWARECLDTWDSRPDIDPRARVSTLNPEQKFILEISRALYGQPNVLILDEPSEHLGAEGVARLFGAVRRVAANGAAVVYISHRVREIREISDRVTVLRDGVNRGTHPTDRLDDDHIVRLIIGRSLDATFPAKPAAESLDAAPVNLVVKELRGAHFGEVSFQIKEGQIVGLAGIDDNGQADIARALAGLESSTGEVSLRGKTISVRRSSSAVRSGIVYAPADRHKEGIFTDLSVRFNSTFRAIGGLSKFGYVSAREERQRSTEALDKYAVKAASPDSPISSLSGGNQQKVVIAGALMTNPELVIVDQPTQGVDVGAKAEIYTHLRAIAASGSSVLMLSSDNTELAGVCDVVHVVSRGQIVATIDGSELSERSITDAVLRAESSREHVRRRPSRWAILADSDYAPLPVLGLLIVGLAIFTQFQNENYLSSRNIGTVLALAAVLAVVTAGQSVVMLRGGIDLSVGPVMSMVVVIASFFIVDGVSPFNHVLGWLLILGMCLLVGVGNWALIDRLRVHPVLATFSTWILLEAIALMLRPIPGGLVAPGIVSGLSARIGFLPIALVISAVIIAALEIWRTRTGSGKRLMAAGDDPSLAGRLGISESRTLLLSYVLCSLLAGVAGILLIGRVGSGSPTAGSLYTLQSVAAAVVGGLSLFGGRGSFVAALVATILLTQVRTVTTFLQLNDAWQSILLSLVTIGAVCAYSILRRSRN